MEGACQDERSEMSAVTAHYREAGSGPAVLLVHASSSSSAQWRHLIERLSPRFHVIAVDIYGHGRSPRWAATRDLTLEDEVALLEPILPTGERIHLVGHSYGGAIAVAMALAYPDRVGSLSLYEPALWGTLVRECRDEAATQELVSLRDETVAYIDAGDPRAAAERFVDYWGGGGGWSALSEERQAALVAGMPALRSGWKAVFSTRPPLREVCDIAVPWFLATGTRSTRPPRRVIELLSGALSGPEVVELAGLNHLGPITHPGVVGDSMAQFLERIR